MYDEFLRPTLASAQLGGRCDQDIYNIITWKIFSNSVRVDTYLRLRRTEEQHLLVCVAAYFRVFLLEIGAGDVDYVDIFVPS